MHSSRTLKRPTGRREETVTMTKTRAGRGQRQCQKGRREREREKINSRVEKQSSFHSKPARNVVSMFLLFRRRAFDCLYLRLEVTKVESQVRKKRTPSKGIHAGPGRSKYAAGAGFGKQGTLFSGGLSSIATGGLRLSGMASSGWMRWFGSRSLPATVVRAT